MALLGAKRREELKASQCGNSHCGAAMGASIAAHIKNDTVLRNRFEIFRHVIRQARRSLD
jgi:hypothetical protein